MYDMFHCYIAICCVQFVSLHDLQNTLHNLAGDSMMVGLELGLESDLVNLHDNTVAGN